MTTTPCSMAAITVSPSPSLSTPPSTCHAPLSCAWQEVAVIRADRTSPKSALRCCMRSEACPVSRPDAVRCGIAADVFESLGRRHPADHEATLQDVKAYLEGCPWVEGQGSRSIS